MIPYYENNGITIYNASAWELLPSITADVIITDPPYGINHPTDYHKRGRDCLAQCSDYAPVAEDDRPFDPRSMLAKNIPIMLWGANHYADKLPPVTGWVVWDKKRPHSLDQATAELAWTNFVKGVRVFRHLWHGMMRDSERGKGKLVHPTQKPIELMQWCLELKWTPEGTVLDPFMGAGSTLIAAQRLERNAIGIELSEKYCEIAVNRLKAEIENPVERPPSTPPL